MAQVSRRRLKPEIEQKIWEIFISSIKNIHTSDDAFNFLNDLLTYTERNMLSKRIAISYLLIHGGFTYDEISDLLKVSKGTIARINTVLVTEGKGYRKIIISLLRKKALKTVLSEMLEGLQPVPPKGVSKAIWYKERAERLKRLQEPF